MASFRVAIDGDLIAPDGSLAFPDFDISALKAPGVEYAFLKKQREIDSGDVADCDALVLFGTRFTEASIPVGDRFALVARAGVGYDNVAVDACRRAGIAVTITPEAVRRPVAVSILTLLFALTSRLIVKDRLGRSGPGGWAEKTRHTGVALTGRTLGSIGFGNIAREMFRLAKPLDMQFIAADPYADAGEAAKLGVTLVDLPTVFCRSDVLTVNCTLNDQTRGLVGTDLLALMKPTAYFINTARGPIVDQRALSAALVEQRIAGAGLDVLEREPPDAADPILELDNVIITPHALCWTDELFRGLGAGAVAATLDVMRGHVPGSLVDRAVLDGSGFRTKLARNLARFGQAADAAHS
jgi:phosphoglycerate dehydrogenase-like enzyme